MQEAIVDLSRADEAASDFAALAAGLPPRAGDGDPPADLADAIRAARSRYQRAMLAWLKQPALAAESLIEMGAALIAVEAALNEPAARVFWWSAAAFVEALGEGQAFPVEQVRPLCSRLDRQLKVLLDGETSTPPELLEELLSYVRQAPPAPFGGTLAEVQAALSPSEPDLSEVLAQLDQFEATLAPELAGDDEDEALVEDVPVDDRFLQAARDHLDVLVGCCGQLLAQPAQPTRGEMCESAAEIARLAVAAGLDPIAVLAAALAEALAHRDALEHPGAPVALAAINEAIVGLEELFAGRWFDIAPLTGRLAEHFPAPQPAGEAPGQDAGEAAGTDLGDELRAALHFQAACGEAEDFLDQLSALAADLDAARQRVAAVVPNTEPVQMALGLQEAMHRRLQAAVLAARRQPLDSLGQRLRRVVREGVRDLTKRAVLEIEGGDLMLERALLTHLAPLLEQLVGNAVSHGIESRTRRESLGKPETGIIRLSAEVADDVLRLTLSDDGRGLDAERMQPRAVALGLIEEGAEIAGAQMVDFAFRRGFSTARRVTARAGHGDGLADVLEQLAALGGTIALESRPGAGVEVRIVLPSALSACKPAAQAEASAAADLTTP